MAEMVRVNTRISATLNDWLDQESSKTGVPKSTLVMLALEQFVQQKKVVDGMLDINSIHDLIENRFKSLEDQLKTVAAAK